MNTPGPTLTDDLMPMITLECGDRLDRVPSGQMTRFARQQTSPSVIASHGIALAGAGLRRRGRGAAMAAIRIENSSAGHVALRWLNRRYSRSRPNPHEFHLYYDI